ncbi:type I-F CRISPR-associated endoribonuclease Cas6/Csy4 [Thiohalomonas denitrificans]|uniref:type I-F CRISPR-associated endoribonuclease Cas6/Csy4 n=1 Tax=Thiohalomonas denitrificans TaxID=415747 RepID=UPI0026EBC3BF|nr:type I-F CRISPR-associated endoribonuclease Cas6/Csy4 [Thiohalomonas denitrificans]
MDHYLDFRLLPDPEFPTPLLMNALFSKLHRALVQIDSRSIGISFPELQQDQLFLGPCLRLHGTAADLERVMTENWLTGMRDHLFQSDLAAVPGNAKHRRIRRVQPKSNAERLRRRHAKRHSELSEEEIALKIPDSVEERVKLPFLRLKSQSNGHYFCVFLEHSPPQAQAINGTFNAYGLSSEATIPWF